MMYLFLFLVRVKNLILVVDDGIKNLLSGEIDITFPGRDTSQLTTVLRMELFTLGHKNSS